MCLNDMLLILPFARAFQFAYSDWLHGMHASCVIINIYCYPFNPLTLFIGMLHLQNYSRDLFLFLYFLLIIVAAMTSFKIHQDKSALTGKSILYLNRHQTEEWKGWMQVLIILLFSSVVFPDSAEIYSSYIIPRNTVGRIAAVHTWKFVHQNYRNDVYLCSFDALMYAFITFMMVHSWYWTYLESQKRLFGHTH